MQLTKDTDRNLLSGVQPRLVQKPATMHHGDVISERFAILSLIGSGSTGDVYKARQFGMDRAVAVKTLRSTRLGDEEALARFVREAKLLSALDHPNICRIYSLGALENGQPYFILDFVSGQPLSDYMDGQTAWTQTQVIDVFQQVTSALQHAHERNIVHRDIKPANLLLERQQECFNVKIVDFGIACWLDDLNQQSLTRAGCVIGSPAYMSPEQCMGKQPDARSDVYSVGCVMYELLTGRRPFLEEEPSALLRAHVMERPDQIAQKNNRFNVSADLVRVVETAMCKEPEHRYQSAEALRSDLERVKLGQSINGTGASGWHQSIAISRPRNSVLSILAGVLIACLILSANWYSKHRDLQRQQALSHADSMVRQSVNDMIFRRFDHADELLANSFDIYTRFGCDAHKLGDICFDRGCLNARFKKYDVSAAQFERAIAYRMAGATGDNREGEIAEARQQLAQVLLRAGHTDAALPLMEQLEQYFLLQPDNESDRTKAHIVNLERLADAYMIRTRYRDSARSYEHLLVAQRLYGAPYDLRAEAARQYALALSRIGRQTESKEALKVADDYDRRARLE